MCNFKMIWDEEHVEIHEPYLADELRVVEKVGGCACIRMIARANLNHISTISWVVIFVTVCVARNIIIEAMTNPTM